MKKSFTIRAGTIDYAVLAALLRAPHTFMMAEYFASQPDLRGWSPMRVRKALNRLARSGCIEREQRIDEGTGNRYMVYRLPRPTPPVAAEP